MTQNKGIQEFGIFQDEFSDANNVDFAKNNIHQPLCIDKI